MRPAPLFPDFVGAARSRDVVFAAAQLVNALQSIAGHETSPTETLVPTIASIEGGMAADVIASRVTLRGTLRWLDPAVRDRALARIEQIAPACVRRCA